MPKHSGLTVDVSDEQLAKAAANRRGQVLAQMYLEMATKTPCNGLLLLAHNPCETGHSADSTSCPKAAWEQAARMAALTVE